MTVCVSLHMCVDVLIHANECVCICLCVYLCVCVCVCACVCVCVCETLNDHRAPRAIRGSASAMPVAGTPGVRVTLEKHEKKRETVQRRGLSFLSASIRRCFRG